MKYLAVWSLLFLSACSSTYKFPIPLDRCETIDESEHACSEKLMRPEDQNKTWSCLKNDPHFEVGEKTCVR